MDKRKESGVLTLLSCRNKHTLKRKQVEVNVKCVATLKDEVDSIRLVCPSLYVCLLSSLCCWW